MKRIIASLVSIIIWQFSFGQESFHDHRRSVEVDKKEDLPAASEGFDQRRIFTGGGINIGYTTTVNGDNSTNNTFNIGAIPEIGYSLSELFDAGIATSINYSSTSNSYYNAKQHNTSYSIGAFGRLHPLENFFVQVMPELDWGIYKTIYNRTDIIKIQSSSFLVGIGYGHRVIGQSYFYTLLMLDLAKDKYSPYNYYDINSGTVTTLPVLRGGFNFYPFRKSH